MTVSKGDLEVFMEEYKGVKSDLIYSSWEYFGLISKITGIDQTENWKEYLDVTEHNQKLKVQMFDMTSQLRMGEERVNNLGHNDITNADFKRSGERMSMFSISELKHIVDVAGNNANRRLLDLANNELIARVKKDFTDPSDTVYNLTENGMSSIPTHLEGVEESTNNMANQMNKLWNNGRY